MQVDKKDPPQLSAGTRPSSEDIKELYTNPTI